MVAEIFSGGLEVDGVLFEVLTERFPVVEIGFDLLRIGRSILHVVRLDLDGR